MRNYRVPSVEKAFAMLDQIGRAPQGMSLAEITEITGFPKTTVFMLATALERIAVLRQVDGRYFLGGHLATLGGQALQRLDLRSVADPVMHRLCDQTGFTVHLGILEQCHVIFVGKVEHEGFIRFSTYVGLAQPFHVSSLGKAIAAFLPEDRLRALITCPLTRRTRYTITEPEAFLKAMEVVRRQGYAVEDEEDEEEVRCIGAPIFDHDGQVVGAVSITAVRTSLPVEGFSHTAQLVMQAAAEISRQLGALKQAGPDISGTGEE